jgi:hypothetical protein
LVCAGVGRLHLEAGSVEFKAIFSTPTVAFLHQGGHHVDTKDQKRKAAARRPSHNVLIFLKKTGAGEVL